MPLTLPLSQQSQNIQNNLALPAPSFGPISMPSTMPTLAPPVMPSVTPPPGTTAGDTLRLQSLINQGTGVSRIHNPFLHGIAAVADGIGSLVAPGIARLTPGTTLNLAAQVHDQEQRVASDQAISATKTANQDAQAQVRQRQAAATLDEAKVSDLSKPDPLQYDYVDGPNGKVAILKGTTNAIPVTTPDGKPLGQKVAPATNAFEFWHQQNPDGTLDDFNQLESKPLSEQETTSLNSIFDPIAGKHGLPQGQFKPGMPRADALQLQSALNQAIGKQQGDTHIVIQQAGQAQKTALAQQKNGTIDMSDPNSQATIQSLAKGDIALNEALPRGASFAQRAAVVAAAKAVNPDFNSGDHNIENSVRRYMTSGQGGTTITAGNTLAHHLDLRDGAIKAINNGDIKAANGFANELGIQLGHDPQTNLQLINQGVATEAARFYVGGVPGEKEIDQFLKPLSGDGSPAQMINGGNTVRGMAAGKMHELQGQATAGSRGQANFKPSNGGGFSTTATGPGGHKIGSNDGGKTWVDVNTGKAVQ